MAFGSHMKQPIFVISYKKISRLLIHFPGARIMVPVDAFGGSGCDGAFYVGGKGRTLLRVRDFSRSTDLHAAGKLEAPPIRSKSPQPCPASPSSILLGNTARHGRGVAFAHRSGYRTIRWTYREVAGAGGAIRAGIGIAKD